MSWGAKVTVETAEAVDAGLHVIAAAASGAGVKSLSVDFMLPRGTHLVPGDVLNLSCVVQRVDSARA